MGASTDVIAWYSLGAAFLCATVISLDERKHPQQMWIMNVVWPATALYLSVFGLLLYFRAGRQMTRERHHTPKQASQAGPTLTQTLVSDCHCGAGCALGDVVAEFAVYFLGLALFGLSLYASFALDFVVAWSLGIVFQYFVIKPMKNLPPRQALIAAIKADTLSIVAFQVGMYAWMAFVFFKLFPAPHLEPIRPSYWMMMQIAMILGFLTAIPVNYWLLKIGMKEKM